MRVREDARRGRAAGPPCLLWTTPPCGSQGPGRALWALVCEKTPTSPSPATHSHTFAPAIPSQSRLTPFPLAQRISFLCPLPPPSPHLWVSPGRLSLGFHLAGKGRGPGPLLQTLPVLGPSGTLAASSPRP